MNHKPMLRLMNSLGIKSLVLVAGAVIVISPYHYPIA